MASAIYTMSARSMIKAQAYADPTPTQVFQLVNTLLEEDAQLGMYLTAFYGVYNTKTGGLRFINAGHTPPLLYRPAAAARPASCASLCDVNFALGMFPFVEFEEAAIQLAPGDVVVLYTDGVNEATNAFDEPFGMERLIRVVLEHGNESPKDLQERIIRSVRAFTGGQEQRDDITVLVVQV
jgi:sigma-B regulation protein RsbU (phosphoserine phosphatase)